MSDAPTSLLRDRRWTALLRRWSPVAVVAVGFSVTWVEWSRERSSSVTIHAQQFQEHASSAARAVEEHLRDAERVLRGARAFIESSESISDSEWASFAGTLRDQAADSGVVRLGWAEVERPVDGAARYISRHCAPADACDGVIGQNAAEFPNRRAAMELAAATGQPTLSRAEAVVVHGVEPRLVMRLCLPVYRPGSGALGLDSARGWVGSPILIGELFTSVVEAESELELHLFDISDGSCDLLHATHVPAARESCADKAATASDPTDGWLRAPIRFGGRDLVLTAEALGPSPRQMASREALPTAVIGAVMSVLVALWVRASSRTQVRAERLARRMTDSLRRSEQRYELAAQASAAGIWEWSAFENRMQLSPRLVMMTGVSAGEDGLGMESWIDLVVHAEDRAEFRASLREHLASGTGFDVRVRARQGSGQYRWVRCNGLASRDWQGRPTIMAGSVIDVHEQHLAEERLEHHAQDLSEANEVLESQAKELVSKGAEVEAARAAADTANRAKSDFLAHLSHEIRTPMTAILGFADVLADEARTRPGLAEWLDNLLTIRRNGEHLLGLVNDVLDMSKIEAGRMSVEHIACSPVDVARDVTAMLGERAGAKGLALNLETRGELPRAIATDPLRLRQILANLVGNAIKFTERGSVTVRIGEASRGRLVFEVIDTGIGLTCEQLARLFQPFEQADATTSRRYGGTGLGLAISRKLAGLLGGELVASSAPGEGSRFVLTIDAPRVASAGGGESGDEPASAGSGGLRARILLAEDGPDNQRLISFHLRRAGAEVEIVGDGRAAMERTLAAERSGRPYDLVLMDLQMPELDGLGATRELRRSGYRGSIVALTASVMSGDRERCLEAGCDDYAAKPIDRDALLATCMRWSRGRGSRLAA